MKNYICTSEGFVMDVTHSATLNYSENTYHEPVVVYTTKLRDAKKFNTKAARSFMEKHDIKGFIWKPYEEDPVRDKYIVKRIKKYGFEYGEEEKHDEIEEWQPVRMFMAHDSDISFLTSKRLQADEGMSFEEAKAEALRRNTEMLGELMGKMNELKIKTENER